MSFSAVSTGIQIDGDRVKDSRPHGLDGNLKRTLDPVTLVTADQIHRVAAAGSLHGQRVRISTVRFHANQFDSCKTVAVRDSGSTTEDAVAAAIRCDSRNDGDVVVDARFADDREHIAAARITAARGHEQDVFAIRTQLPPDIVVALKTVHDDCRKSPDLIRENGNSHESQGRFDGVGDPCLRPEQFLHEKVVIEVGSQHGQIGVSMEFDRQRTVTQSHIFYWQEMIRDYAVQLRIDPPPVGRRTRGMQIVGRLIVDPCDRQGIAAGLPVDDQQFCLVHIHGWQDDIRTGWVDRYVHRGTVVVDQCDMDLIFEFNAPLTTTVSLPAVGSPPFTVMLVRPAGEFGLLKWTVSLRRGR